MVIYDKDKGKLFIPENDDNSMYGYQDVYKEGFADGYADGYEEAAEECGEAIDYASKYFTIEVKEGGSLEIPEKVSHYRLNGGEWVENNHAIIFTRPGDRIEMKGINTDCQNFFQGTEKPERYFVYGNIMSMLYGDDFQDKYDYEVERVFYWFFKDCTGLEDASDLVLQATGLTRRCYTNMFRSCVNLVAGPKLPATVLASSCYNLMFIGCENLLVAPELPATTLAADCYNDMFSNCHSLVVPPELPATTLAKACYEGMFQYCENLIKAPELPATILADSCYQLMFRECSNLNYVKCLATDISADRCVENWLSGVAEEGTFVKDEEMEDWDEGASGIPNNWTIIDE